MNHPNQPKAKDMIDLPGPYTFKVFVKPEMVTAEQLRELVQNELNRSVPIDLPTKNASRTGKYEAHTLRLQIEEYSEIEALYRAFQAMDGIVMTL